MANLELDDIQGLVARGYGKLKAACYVVLQIQDATEAHDWISTLSDKITPASIRPSETALQIAFTVEGLRKLGLTEEELKSFSRQFWEGMTDATRAQFLGDVEESSPEKWRWGGPDTPAHVLLLLFSKDQTTLDTEYAAIAGKWKGVSEVAYLGTHIFDSPLEHFGFSDGIAQPIIDGLSRTGPPANTLAPGEFVLGYKNEYDKIPLSPKVASSRDTSRRLPKIDVENGQEAADLGRNGTYLVFRELEQDVKAFWEFVSKASKELHGTSDHDKRLSVGAKMVGRWPSGAPMTLCPEEDNPDKATHDSFGYRENDAKGLSCPMGAHIRRTNPRDALEGSCEESVTVSNRHRILRRGRPYGAPISRTLDVDEILAAEKNHEECGLHFLGINTDISRQFEFIQNTWINNPKFAGLYSDADPLMGNHEGKYGTYTMQSRPVRKRITGIKRFVEVRGGAYFFLPGLRALRFLSTLKNLS